jgi:hypothetical protein
MVVCVLSRTAGMRRAKGRGESREGKACGAFPGGGGQHLGYDEHVVVLEMKER